MKKGLILFLSLLPVLLLAREITSQQMIDLVKPAVVFVEYYHEGYVQYKGQTFGSPKGGPFLESHFGTLKRGPFEEGNGASGFIVHPDGYIITAGHCVQDYPEGKIRIILAFVNAYILPQLPQDQQPKDQKEFQQLIQKVLQDGAQIVNYQKKIYVRTGNTAAYQADVLVVSPFSEKDVAIIKIPGKHLPTIPVGNSDNVRDGDQFWLIGYPSTSQDLSQSALTVASLFIPTITAGVVSGIKPDTKGTMMIQTDALLSGGNSGGPGINSKGEAIGISSWGRRIGATTGQNVTDITETSFFVPVNQAMIFVRQAGFTPHPGLVDTLYRRALEYYWDGKWGKAVKEFNSLLEFYPYHPTAVKYRMECLEKLAQGGKGGKGGVLLWVILGIIGVAVVVAAVLVVPRMLKAKPKAPAAGVGYLVVETGPSAGKRFELKKETKIGRDANASQIVLSDNVVSRQHAVITPAPEGAKIRHLSTTNPTLVNGQAITETTLKDGDRIKIGSTVFVYKTQ